MNKTIARCTFLVAFGSCLTISLVAPWVLGDSNNFLKDFVNHEFLNLLGVIVAITLASAGNLYLEFNRIEDQKGERCLNRTRAAVKKSCFWLIGLFAFAFILAIAKPLIPQDDISTSIANSLAILIIIFNILVLIDLMMLVFKVKPIFEL